MHSHCIHTICIAFSCPISILLYANGGVHEKGEGEREGREHVYICIINEYIVTVLWVVYWPIHKIYICVIYIPVLLARSRTQLLWLYIDLNIRYICYIFLYYLLLQELSSRKLLSANINYSWVIYQGILTRYSWPYLV